MTKVKSLADLKAMREKFQSNLDVREKSNNQEEMVQIKVAMATCGIASGAKQIMEYMMEKADAMKIRVVFTQTGCMGYCHAEPTIEVKVPGRDPLVFGHVDNKKADEIFEKYILNNEMVDGIIPVNYEVIDK
ncbi:MAG: (2Fe-2S) ferredoxin domain-containing protein [Bacteroidales bacterium]|nr:(2Fe-2S) ferredoxin domain-containing protein [Bacteroidales bacterium]